MTSTMRIHCILLSALATFLFLSSVAFAQKIEVGGYAGGQVNGGTNLSTLLFHSIDVGNGVNYGATVGYLLGEHGGIEFQWNHNSADASALPNGGGPGIKLFTLNQNQYLGNLLLYFKPTENAMRPYVLVGLGATNLSTNVSAVQGSTKFAFALGGGAKYYMTKHFGLRGQLRYSSTYLTTTSTGGYWCDPIWGGCWVSGNAHYLNVFDATGGITFRF